MLKAMRKAASVTGAGSWGLVAAMAAGILATSRTSAGSPAPEIRAPARKPDGGSKTAEKQAAAPGVPQTTSPSGEYRAARITLLALPPGPDYHLDGGFRQGKMPVISRHSHRDLAGYLELTGDAISGSFSFGRAGEGMPDFRLAVEAKVAPDGTVSGSYSGETWPTFGVKGAGKKVDGKVAGFVRTEQQLAALQKGFAAGADWPTWAGPGASFSAKPTGAKLVDDLSKARLLWRSEQATPQGPGSLFTLRAPLRALTGRSGGGGASPVFADGRVHLNYYEPTDAGGIEQQFKFMDVLEKHRAEKVAKGEWTIAELHPECKAKFYVRADQVMLCLDATTGRTLWKTVFPNAGINRQSHKTGPMNCTPVVGGGKVIAMDTGGKLKALDAQTGQFLWAAQLASPGGPSTRGWCHAANVIGGVVIASDQGATLVGLDAATGKTLWSLPQGTTALTPIAVPWSHGGKDYALSVGSTGNDREAQGVLRLIDPAAGKALWELPIHAPGKGVTVHQDIALMFSGASSGEGDEDDKKGKSDTKPGMTQSQSALNCVAVRLSIDKPSKLWSIPCPWSNGNLAPAASPRGHVCLAGREEARLLDLQTGKELAACKAPGPANEGQVEQVEDRFLMTHDGSHGRQTLTMLPDSADAFAAMGQPVYAFLHMQTTSYHNVPMTRCYVDGRIFIRGMEAIYCYDLRQ